MTVLRYRDAETSVVTLFARESGVAFAVVHATLDAEFFNTDCLAGPSVGTLVVVFTDVA